jgi:E3 ubiquitin-protein ligase RGLG
MWRAIFGFGGGGGGGSSAPAHRRDSASSDASAPRSSPRSSASAGAHAPHATGFAPILDQYETLSEVQAALRARGLHSAALCVAIDFTKSNEWTGRASFGGRCMHAVAPPPAPPTPYERAIRVIGRTLEAFDDDGLIPAFGFGDASTGDAAVFSLLPGGAPARGCAALLERYRQLAPSVTLAGPTSFGPAIRAAAAATVASGNEFTILLLLADGQVTRSADVPPGQLSPQEADTVDALVAASRAAALAVVLVGVGDGPWDTMRAFDDALPARSFDNFQFVQLSDEEYGAGYASREAADAAFALAALQEVPDAHAACARLGLLGRARRGAADALGPRVAVREPPPLRGRTPTPSPRSSATGADVAYRWQPQPQPSAPPLPLHAQPQHPPAAAADAATCAICLDAPRDTALVPCGHACLCFRCAGDVMRSPRPECPICRATPSAHMRLYL